MIHDFTRRTVLGLAAAATVAIAAPAAAQPAEQQNLVAESTQVFTQFANDPQMSWIKAHLHEAQGVIIAPSVVKAGFIFGGSGGHAVLVARRPDGKWTGPAFYTLASASFGFQAGASGSQMVALIMNKNALNKILTGSLKLGPDVSIATGPVGGGAKSNVKADVVAYAKSKGLYGGVNFSGTSISPRNSSTEAYFGKSPLTPIDLFVAPNPPAPPAGAGPLLAAVGARTK